MPRLSLRDRFFTPPVARAMMSPSGILLAGAGAAAGILAFGNPIGALALAALAWAGRVGFSVPRNPRGERIDPFTLGEPWRRFVQGAMQAEARFDQAVRSARSGPLRDRLEEIGVPTLIVWGRNDRVVPVPAALSYRKRIGDNAELVIFDECGHVPQIERPVRFNRVLERFLAREGVLD